MTSDYSVYGKGMDRETAIANARRRLPPNALEGVVETYERTDDPSIILAEIKYSLKPEPRKKERFSIGVSAALPTEVEAFYRSR